ncbi:MFS transporter [Streptosporangium sp. NPDC000396]|uniref:MFS transporter n=1 Tax=Streptosporangium sp. NPDC000396 TaxID=3366185 RepID=UPI00368AED83
MCDDYGTMPATMPFRLARSTAFAVVSVGLSVVAHVFAGGTVPAWSAAGALALVFTAAFPATGRERGVRVILPLLGGAQAALHLLFTTTDSALFHPGHAHPHSAGLLPGLAMLVMHGWAVGLTALWLARGEALLWALLRRLGARLGPVLAEPSPVPVPPSAVPRSDGPVVLRPSLLRHVVSRRGPPTLRPVTSF